MHINMLAGLGEDSIPIGHYIVKKGGKIQDLTSSLLNVATSAFHKLDWAANNTNLVEITVSWVGNSTQAHAPHSPEFISAMAGLGLCPPRKLKNGPFVNSHIGGIKSIATSITAAGNPGIHTDWSFIGVSTSSQPYGRRGGPSSLTFPQVRNAWQSSDDNRLLFRGLGGWGIIGVKSWLLHYYIQHLFLSTLMWNKEDNYTPGTLEAQKAFSPLLPCPRLAMRFLYDGLEVLIQYTCDQEAANEILFDAGLGHLDCLYLHKLVLPEMFVQEYTEGKHDEVMNTYGLSWNLGWIHSKWVNAKNSAKSRERKIKEALILPFKTDQAWKGYISAIHGTPDVVAALSAVTRWVRHNRGSAHARPKRSESPVDSLISYVINLFERTVLYSALVVSQDPIIHMLYNSKNKDVKSPLSEMSHNLRQGVWILANRRRNIEQWKWRAGFDRGYNEFYNLDQIDYLSCVSLGTKKYNNTQCALERALNNKLRYLKLEAMPTLLAPKFKEWREDVEYYKSCQRPLLCRWAGPTKMAERNLRSFIQKRLEPFLNDREAYYAKTIKPNGFWGVALCYLGVPHRENKEETQLVCRILGEFLPSLSMDRLGLCPKETVLRGGNEVPLSGYNEDILGALLGYKSASDVKEWWNPSEGTELTWLKTWSNIDSVIIWVNLLEILEREHKCIDRAKALYVLYASLLVSAASQIPPLETGTSFVCSTAGTIRIGKDGLEQLNRGHENRNKYGVGKSWGTGTSESDISSLYIYTASDTKRALLYPEIGKRIEALAAELGEECPSVHTELLAKIHSGELFSPAPPQTFAQALGLYLIKNKIHY